MKPISFMKFSQHGVVFNFYGQALEKESGYLDGSLGASGIGRRMRGRGAVATRGRRGTRRLVA
jgi:hypothetical protein